MRDSRAKAFIGHCDFLDDAVSVLDLLPDVAIRIAEGENLPTGFTPLKDLFIGTGDFPTYPNKYPRLIKFFNELPKTAAGKILKRAISISD